MGLVWLTDWIKPVSEPGALLLVRSEAEAQIVKKKKAGFKGATQIHAVLLCLYVADPATFLASHSVLIFL